MMSAKAMSSSASVAAPVPSTEFPSGAMYQFMSPWLSNQSCSYFQRLSKGLVVGVDGQQHPVADPFGDG